MATVIESKSNPKDKIAFGEYDGGYILSMSDFRDGYAALKLDRETIQLLIVQLAAMIDIRG
jgi:hypothetical protein